MAIAHVASGVGSPSVTSSGVTINSTGANLIVASVSSYFAKTGFTLTDNQGNTWTALTGRTNSSQAPHAQQYYCLNPTTNASHTITAAGTDMYGVVAVHAFSGVDAYNAQAGAATTAFTQETTFGTSGITPPSDGAVFIGLNSFNATSTETVDSPFTGLIQQNFGSGLNLGLAAAYYIQTTAGSQAVTFNGSNTERAVSLCCFTAATATGQPASRRMGGVKFAGNQSLGMVRW